MRLVLTYIIIFCTSSLFGQVAQPAGKLYANTSAGGIVHQFNTIEKENARHYYMDKEWKNGSLYLKSGVSLEDFPLRYDYLYDRIEIKFKPEVKSLDGFHLDYFKFKDTLTQKERVFLNAEKFSIAIAPEIGFYEVLLSDSITLLVRNELQTREPTYVPALDVGDRNIQYYIETKYYKYCKGKLTRIQKTKKSKKEVFRDLFDNMNSYIKENKLSMDDKSDLITVFIHYNEISTGK